MEVLPNTSSCSHTGRLLSTGAHGGSMSVELRDGGEELSTPAVKYECVRDEHGMSLASGLEREAVYCRPQIPTGHVIYRSSQHQISTSPQPTWPSPSCPPPSPNPDVPLGKYAKHLRDYYTQHRPPNIKWPPLNKKKYIKLAVISNVYANRKDLVKIREKTIHGFIDGILEQKAPIRMEDILKPNIMHNYETHRPEEFPVNQLLIEGAPGIGKSTFAWEVCQKWGQHKLFTEYALVVLLRFRDKWVQEAKSISDLFYHPNPKLQSEIVNDITESGGHGLLLILEGFDEASTSKRAMDSIFVRLFMGQELPKATVILTTRPSFRIQKCLLI